MPTTIILTVTDAGLNLIADALAGLNTAKLLYVAVGSGTATPTDGDTALGAESFRKAITSYTRSGTGLLVVTLYLSQTDAIGLDIEEIGIFGGATATPALGSGVLYARGLFPHGTKTNLESINLQCAVPTTRS